MELTISLLITALVIGLTYSSYTITARTYSHFHRRNDSIANLARARELLAKDFFKADSIFQTDSGILIRHNSLTVRYILDSNRMVRIFARVDTFKFRIQDVAATFEGQPVAVRPGIQEADRIDELTFSVLSENQKIPFHYHKKYSSVSLINRKAHAVN
jgi:hypothetical protein